MANGMSLAVLIVNSPEVSLHRVCKYNKGKFAGRIGTTPTRIHRTHTRTPQQCTYTGDTASPKHQHHTSISTRSSPYIVEFEQFLIAVQKGLSYKMLRMLGGCDEVQAISVTGIIVKSKHPWSTTFVPSSSKVLFFVTVRPWCLSSSLSSPLWGWLNVGAGMSRHHRATEHIYRDSRVLTCPP